MDIPLGEEADDEPGGGRQEQHEAPPPPPAPATSMAPLEDDRPVNAYFLLRCLRRRLDTTARTR